MYTHVAATCHCDGALLRSSRLLLAPSSSRHKIIIPTLATRQEGPSTATAAPVSSHGNEYQQYSRVRASAVAALLPPESAAELHRAEQIDVFREANEAAMVQAWKSSKPHLRKQEKMVEDFGVEGAVREMLQPSTISFREQLRQRPLDRAILQEIYLGLHGRRIERRLKRGVSWEHWITKGDGSAPVFTTSYKAQQTFAFGGDIQQVRCATHPQQFPVVLSSARRERAASTASSTTASGGSERPLRKGGWPVRQRPGHRSHPNHPSSSLSAPHHHRHPRLDLLPEVAFVGRTSAGKSSLVNAVVNAMITPYGHLRGTTSSVRFYSVANRLLLVDCPGYGHYDPLMTPGLDAENAVRAMRAYLKTGAAPGALEKKERRRRGTKRKGGDAHDAGVEGVRLPSHVDEPGDVGGATGSALAAGDATPTPSVLYQPRNIKRVFLCASAQGLQHLDYVYCDLLEAYRIPFAVVLTKTDAAPIRFLARLTDYTRSRLVHYSQCKELLLTSSLRMAGIDKVQELLGSFAAADDRLHGATTDFNTIV